MTTTAAYQATLTALTAKYDAKHADVAQAAALEHGLVELDLVLDAEWALVGLAA